MNMDMDMGGSTMANMATVTTSTAAAATATAMSMSMGGGSGCKISMLWNWNTVNSCFISSSWHITSDGMFAGSCVGVILLVISLEFLRRLGKEYDRYILRQHKTSLTERCTPTVASAADKSASVYDTEITPHSGSSNSNAHARNMPFRPNIFQQMIRATLHMVQFAVAYFIMLLAMYYNGYFIICIFIGAWIGSFTFSWEQVTFIGPQEEITVCCG